MRTLFEYGPLVAWAGLLLWFVRPLRLGRVGNYALGFFLLVASQKFLIYKFFGGDSFVPDLPERFVNLTGWTYSSCILLFGFSGLWWLVCGLRRLWLHWTHRGQTVERPSPSEHPAARPLDVCVLLSSAVLAVFLAGWGVWEGVRVPRVREVTVAVKGLPRAFDGLRLVQLSDLHCSPAARRARTAGIVDAVNALSPDLICITGDFVDGSPEERLDDLLPLKDLQAPLGVFGCAGNHEYYHDYQVWQPVFAELGIRMLDNAHAILERGGEKLVLGGVTDFAAAWNNRRIMEGPDVKKAFAGSPAFACRILLQHQPIELACNCEEEVRLQLSGHTHGGAVFGLDRLVKRLNQGHVRGLYKEGDLALYVSSGTGQWAGFPLRLGVPAEITLLTLRRE